MTKMPSYAVPYPGLFWSQYTALGSQTPTPKRSKVLISGVSFRKRSLSQSQKSDVLSYSEPKIAKNFQGFATGEGLERRPRLPGCTMVFPVTTLVEKPAPPKNCWIRHCYVYTEWQIQTIYAYLWYNWFNESLRCWFAGKFSYYLD